jgi:hypothetical protein
MIQSLVVRSVAFVVLAAQLLQRAAADASV